MGVPFEITAGEDCIEVTAGPAEGLKEERIELEFPRGLGWTRAGQEGCIVLPVGMGAICDFSPSRKPLVVELAIYSGGQTGLTMPLFGTFGDHQALGCIVQTPYDCRVRTEINLGKGKVYCQTPVWVIDARTNTTRRARYFPMGRGGYVAIAKRYRSELMESGRLVALGQKAAGNPEVDLTIGSLLGHRHLAWVEPPGADPCDRSNAYGFFRAARREGFDRVIAHNVLRGEPSMMSKAAEFARSLSPGFRLSVYENYLDIFRPGEQVLSEGTKRYPDWDESLICRERDGSMRRNWRVRRKGQPDIWTYTVCPARRLQVALPQMDEMLKVLGRGSIYIDVEGAVPLMDCHDPRHAVTKEMDAEFRRQILSEVKKRFGVVTTEALPQDFLAGSAEVGSYFSVFPYSGYGNSSFRVMPPMIPVPLHPLVWHGSILNQTGTGTNFYQSDPPHAALFGWLADTMDEKGRRIAYQLRGTARAEMLSHKFVTGPRVVVGPDDAFHCDDVQMTRFSDGTVVIANFASLPYRWSGACIPPMDFVIFNERLSIKIRYPRKVRLGDGLTAEISLANTWNRRIPPSVLTILGRGTIHRESPLFERRLRGLVPGASVSVKAALEGPREEGRFWLLATLRVPGDDPWEACAIHGCEARS